MSKKDTPPKARAINSLTERRTDEIVDRYVTSDTPLAVLLSQSPEPRSLLVQALLHVQECIEGKRLAKETMELAQAVPLKGWNSELLILFLSSWADLSCRIGRPSAAETLLHRARSIVSDETHPEILAAIMLVESNLADATGNKSHCEEILKDILTTISEHSARRKTYVWERALFLAQQGRGTEAQEEIKELSLQSQDRFRASRLVIVQFVDAIETGQIQAASEYMSQLKTSVHNPRDMTRFSFKGYQALLALMHKTPKPSNPQPVAPPHPRVAVIEALLRGDAGEALSKARLEANRVLGSIFASGFESFNLVRAELAAGNAESAQRIIKMRQSRGNEHYLDDLFLARAELLQSNGKKAARHFADLLRAVDFYKARGRLDFELRMAREVSEGDIMRLTQDAAKSSKKRSLGVYTLRDKDGHTVSSQKLRKPGTTATAKPREPTTPLEEAAQLGVSAIRGRSGVAEEIRQSVNRFADLDAPVLITGETGTGKELVARALHATSARAGEPFVVINCGAITESLLESELFGHEKGAFTGADRANKGLFEATGKGTILLDEIGDISHRLQATLLRVLETGEIRSVGSTKTRNLECRIVAATNVDLEQASQENLFRTDLLFRMQRLGIHLPPLRERKDDVLVLARHFLDTGRRIGVHAVLSNGIRAALRGYDWPGNVRELHNVIERMRLMHSDKLSYDIEDLDIRFHRRDDAALGPEATSDAPRLRARPRARADQPDSGIRPRYGAAPTAVPPKPTFIESEMDVIPTAPAPAIVVPDTIEHILAGGTSAMRRLEKLRAVFTQHKRLTRKEIIQILDVSPNTATKYLQTLATEGFIRVVDPNGSSRSRYFERVEGA